MTIAARAAEIIGLHHFASPGTPEEMAMLHLSAPANRQYVLRMAIRVAGGEYLIPSELEWIRPMLAEALAHQVAIGAVHPFCYVTIRHGIVDSITDDEWHVDGFSTKVAHVPEQNYIWCSHSGTEYASIEAEVPADFDPLKHNINHFLADLVEENRIEACKAQTIYCMDPYHLHRRPADLAGHQRTFIRISFVPIEIDDVHNTQNPLLPRHYTRDGVAYRDRLATYPAGPAKTTES